MRVAVRFAPIGLWAILIRSRSPMRFRRHSWAGHNSTLGIIDYMSDIELNEWCQACGHQLAYHSHNRQCPGGEGSWSTWKASVFLPLHPRIQARIHKLEERPSIISNCYICPDCGKAHNHCVYCQEARNLHKPD